MYQKEEYSRNRQRILLALFKQPMDFTALKDETKLSEPSLSRHLKDLLNSGYVELKREGRRKVYRLAEKAYEDDFLLMYLIGLHSAFKILRHDSDFWERVGEEAVKLAALGDHALMSFISVISKFVPRNPPEKVKGKLIFDEIMAKMISDFSSLEKMRETIHALEARGSNAEAVQEKFQDKLDRLTSIYFALGPPFSYLWKNMVEDLEK